MIQLQRETTPARHSRLAGLFGYVVGAILLLFLGSVMTAWGACDPSIDCNSCTNKGERMKCKFDALADESSILLNKLQEPPFADVQTPASMDGLNRSQGRLQLEKGRLQSDDFRLLAKKKETSCQTVEAAAKYGGKGNGDGICDPGEDCAEVFGDGIGDDNGICSPRNGKKREVCAQICDEEATLQDEDNVDDDLAAELEGVFDETKGYAREMNDSLEEVASLLENLEINQDPDDPCPLDAEGLSRTSAELYALAKGAAVGARGGADIAERLCDQQVMMNCAACCAPAEVIAGALEAAWTAIEITEGTINSATIDTALNCVAKLKKTASDNNVQLLQIESDLKVIEQTQSLVIEWLNTPQGQRPYFSKN